MADHLIVGHGPLLDPRGYLREPGYALRPPFAYSRAAIKAPAIRIKEWDYYLVNDDHYAVALTLGDMGYSGLVSASVMDFDACTFKTTSAMTALPLGRFAMPNSSDVGDSTFDDDRCHVSFAHTPAGRRLSFTMKEFDGADDFEFEALLDNEPRDSMVIATPWREDPLAFYYNRKIVAMRAWGGFRRGALFHEFDPASSFGLLDWGRGVWTYDNTWYWAAAQGRQAGHVVGLNLGYGFGDTTAASENMVFVDGIAHKLGRVDFGIPSDGEPGGCRYMEPWHMTDDEGRLDLTFEPDIDRRDFVNGAGLIVSDQHQVYGLFSGTITLDDGSSLCIDGLRGSAEHIHNRY